MRMIADFHEAFLSQLKIQRRLCRRILRCHQHHPDRDRGYAREQAPSALGAEQRDESAHA